VQLLIFERHDSPKPVKTIDLDPGTNRTFYFWHVHVAGVTPGMGYAYRVDGPRDLHGAGHRFNPNKVLIDPYGRHDLHPWDRVAAAAPATTWAPAGAASCTDMADYDWEGDQPLRRSMVRRSSTMHVRGFTKSPTSGARHPGTYRGSTDPYSEGATAVELLPSSSSTRTRSGRTADRAAPHQLLGLAPISFFNPHEGYCVAPDEGTHVKEFGTW
jgi:glycogen operon protein